MPKYCEYSKHVQYRIPKYVQVQKVFQSIEPQNTSTTAVFRGIEPQNTASKAVFAIQNLEILPSTRSISQYTKAENCEYLKCFFSKILHSQVLGSSVKHCSNTKTSKGANLRCGGHGFNITCIRGVSITCGQGANMRETDRIGYLELLLSKFGGPCSRLPHPVTDYPCAHCPRQTLL